MELRLTNRLRYLVLIRWVALSSFLMIALGTPYLHVPSRASFILLGLQAVSNACLHLIYKKIPQAKTPWATFLFLELDILTLAFLVLENGGAHNPFSSLVLVFCGLGALLLPLRQLLGILLTTLGALYVIYSALPDSGHHHAAHDFNLHLKGMWLANSLGVLLVSGWIYYTKTLNEKILRKNEATQRILARVERLESVGRLAAEAAHRINTPLGTLQLGLSELNDATHPLTLPERERWLGDMQNAIDQISSIVSRIHSLPDESDGPLSLKEFLLNWVTHWSNPRRITVSVDLDLEDRLIGTATAEGLGHALTVLLDNAYDALVDKSRGNIHMDARQKGPLVLLSVSDDGCGMDEATRRQALEPLFTTKEGGTGLGLYLCRQLAQKYEGSVEIRSSPGAGTTVTLALKKSLMN